MRRVTSADAILTVVANAKKNLSIAVWALNVVVGRSTSRFNPLAMLR
jgi:hypothetical protein